MRETLTETLKIKNRNSYEILKYINKTLKKALRRKKNICLRLFLKMTILTTRKDGAMNEYL